MPNPDAVYDVLVKHAKAPPGWRFAFVAAHEDPAWLGVWILGDRLRYVRERNRVTKGIFPSLRVFRTNAALAALESDDARS